MSLSNDGWNETSAGLYFVQDKSVVFYDDWDHWRNGFCRLLEISDETARELIEQTIIASNSFAKLSAEEKILLLKSAVQTVFKLHKTTATCRFENSGMCFDGSPADTVYAQSISGNSERSIVGNKKLGFAWQVSSDDGRAVTADSVNYDELYFQSPQQAHLGMRNYTTDQDWRLDKARRQFKIAAKNTKLEAKGELDSSLDSNLKQSSNSPNILDVGSAAGYFRKAADEAGCTHYGLEQSADAIEICKAKFGYQTLRGEIVDLPALAPQLLGKLDLITLWDVIEHLDDGLSTLNILKQFLSASGAIVIRTPNLVSHEYDVLKDFYYSFKLDHIKYYSPESLNKLATLSGLKPTYLETTSHLFKGLLGMDFMHQCMMTNSGADIIAIYQHA